MRDLTRITRTSAELRKTMRFAAPRRSDGTARLLHAGLDDPEHWTGAGLFGSRDTARGPGARHVVSAFLDIRRPFEAPADCITLQDVLSRMGLEGVEDLRGSLLEAGHDGLHLSASSEHDADRWWPVKASQIQKVAEMETHACRNPWEIDRSTWIGPAIISDIFDIEGRSEEFDHLWEALEEEGGNLGVLARLDGGWSVRWLDDWEPEGTVGLFDPKGCPKGFYMGAMAWIDEDARGRGLSSHMILAVGDLLGGSPTRNIEGLGYSDAGHAAHVAAHALALSRRPDIVLEADSDMPLP